MRVSVILPVRDGALLVAQAIESALGQTLAPSELLVVDGGSTDRTREIVRGYPGATLLRQSGPSLASAYNEALALARGDAFAFLSHDDVWLPRKLEVQAERLRRRSELDYVLCRTEIFLEPGSAPPPGARLELVGRPAELRLLEALLVRRETARAVGPFREEFSPGADTDWIARLNDRGARFEYLDEVLLRRRIQPASTSCSSRMASDLLARVLRASIERKRGLGEPSA